MCLPWMPYTYFFLPSLHFNHLLLQRLDMVLITPVYIAHQDIVPHALHKLLINGAT